MDRSAQLVDKLTEIINKYTHSKFVLGTNDCATIFGECFECVTGTNPISKYIGTYNSETSAIKCLISEDCNSMMEFCLRHLSEKPRLWFMDGDFATVRNMQLLMSPLIIVRGHAFGYNDRGAVWVPASEFHAVYRAVAPIE